MRCKPSSGQGFNESNMFGNAVEISKQICRAKLKNGYKLSIELKGI